MFITSTCSERECAWARCTLKEADAVALLYLDAPIHSSAYTPTVLVTSSLLLITVFVTGSLPLTWRSLSFGISCSSRRTLFGINTSCFRRRKSASGQIITWLEVHGSPELLASECLLEYHFSLVAANKLKLSSKETSQWLLEIQRISEIAETDGVKLSRLSLSAWAAATKSWLPCA